MPDYATVSYYLNLRTNAAVSSKEESIGYADENNCHNPFSKIKKLVDT